MDVVIDTNVLLYALLGVTNHAEPSAEVLARAEAIWAPDLLRSELVNALWQYVRERTVSAATAVAVMDDAEALVTHVVPASELWLAALLLSIAH
jgi:predicted nucleic acid-binding protein